VVLDLTVTLRAVRGRTLLLGGALLAAAAIVACGTSDPEGASLPIEAGAAADSSAPGDATTPFDGGTGVHDAAAPPADAAPPPVTCPPAGKLVPGEVTQTLTMNGVARTYIVHVPPGYTGQTAVPIVFDFHPLQVQATTWKVATGWSGVADKQGFILVWPQGVGDSWNAGRCCGQAQQQGVDDVAFLRAMLAQIAGDGCVDPKRVYATGCSNGGGMVYRIACDAADIVAAVAPVDFDCITGPTNTPSCASCSPARHISVAQFRGTSDTAVPYDGGPTTVVPGLVFPGAPANFADWGTRNGCSGSPQTESKYPLCETYPTCAGGVETTLCSIPLGTHCASYIPYGIAAVAWDMLQAHTLQ
jgi:polyhydroxybutyrate depolymerase